MSVCGRQRRTHLRAALPAVCCLAGVLVVPLAGSTHRAHADGRPNVDAIDVRYEGPAGRLARLARLRATAGSTAARIVAVTFVLDGHPIGSITEPPFELDVDTGLLPAGAHRLRTLAVDSLGRTAATPPVVVRTTASLKGVVLVRPEIGLEPVRARLRAGGVTVHLRPGRYQVDELVLGSNARLVGSGRGTMLAAAPGSPRPLLLLHGRNIRVSDLAIDAGGQSGDRPIAVAVDDGSANVQLERLRITGVRGDAVNIWGAHSGVSVQDSLIDGGGSGHAGVFVLESETSRGTSVLRTQINGFRSFGIIFAQSAYGLRDAGLRALALGDRISNVRDPARAVCRSQPLQAGCGTNEIGIESGSVGAAIIGNTITKAAWDGIETVGSSTGTSVAGNTISQTLTGIYLEHATNRSLITRNAISAVETGINVEWRYGGVGSSRNTFDSNRVSDARRHGLFVGVGANVNTIVRNVFTRGARPAIVLQGSSENRVRRNRGCGSRGPLIAEEAGRSATGALDHADGNRLAANVSNAPC